MLVFEVKKNDKEILSKLLEQESTQLIEPMGFDGDAIVQCIIKITEITAPLITSIILTYINSNKLEVKRNGVNITIPLRKKSSKKVELIKEIMTMLDEDNSSDEEINN